MQKIVLDVTLKRSKDSFSFRGIISDKNQNSAIILHWLT